MAPTTELRTVRVPLSQAIQRLEVFCCRMERRYEYPSWAADDAVRSCQLRETAEVAKWLISYRTLQRLRAYAGEEIGTSTPTTG